MSSAGGSAPTLWFGVDFCHYEHKALQGFFCMIGARQFLLQISNGDLSKMILVLQILSSSHHAGKKKLKIDYSVSF